MTRRHRQGSGVRGVVPSCEPPGSRDKAFPEREGQGLGRSRQERIGVCDYGGQRLSAAKDDADPSWLKEAGTGEGTGVGGKGPKPFPGRMPHGGAVVVGSLRFSAPSRNLPPARASPARRSQQLERGRVGEGQGRTSLC